MPHVAIIGGGIVGRRLCEDEWTLYCSRDYAAAHGVPTTQAQLKKHAFIGIAALALSASGVIIVIPMLAQLLAGNTALGPMMIIPEVLIVGGMLTFILNLLKVWRAPAAAA